MKILKSLNSRKPKVKKLTPGDIYAVHSGQYAGELLIYIDQKSADYHFLAVPTMLNRVISVSIVDYGIECNIIKFVEASPDYVYQVAAEQFKKNENFDNRRL